MCALCSGGFNPALTVSTLQSYAIAYETGLAIKRVSGEFPWSYGPAIGVSPARKNGAALLKAYNVASEIIIIIIIIIKLPN
jgi:hypothetical protein